MAFDPRWKNPQSADPQVMWRWAQDLITELRKGAFSDAAFEANVGDGLTNAQLADMAAWTIKMRNNAASGDPEDVTINGLTEETSIDPAADFLPLWDAGSSVMRKAKPNNLGLKPTLIASGAISSAASVDIPVDGQAWDEVVIDLINIIPENDISTLRMRFDQGSGFLSGASDYQWAVSQGGSVAADTADSEITLAQTLGTATNERLSLKAHLYRPTDADFIKAVHWQGGYRNAGASALDLSGWGELIANDDALTDVRVLFTGNIASGYYYAIGYKYA
jgi:hypothetical protein